MHDTRHLAPFISSLTDCIPRKALNENFDPIYPAIHQYRPPTPTVTKLPSSHPSSLPSSATDSQSFQRTLRSSYCNPDLAESTSLLKLVPNTHPESGRPVTSSQRLVESVEPVEPGSGEFYAVLVFAFELVCELDCWGEGRTGWMETRRFTIPAKLEIEYLWRSVHPPPSYSPPLSLGAALIKRGDLFYRGALETPFYEVIICRLLPE